MKGKIVSEFWNFKNGLEAHIIENYDISRTDPIRKPLEALLHIHPVTQYINKQAIFCLAEDISKELVKAIKEINKGGKKQQNCFGCVWLKKASCLKPGPTIYGAVDPERQCMWCPGKEINNE